jgi:hypothetical protein
MPALGWAFVRQHQTAGDGSRDFHLFHPCGNLFFIRFEATAELIRVDKLFEGLSAPCNMLSGRQAKGHTDHNFFILRYF